jgi:hypothetical protein
MSEQIPEFFLAETLRALEVKLDLEKKVKFANEVTLFLYDSDAEIYSDFSDVGNGYAPDSERNFKLKQRIKRAFRLIIPRI